MRTKKLFNLAKGFSIFFVIIGILTVIHQWTYSNVPLFTQYLLKTLLGIPGVGQDIEPIGQVNLPRFLIVFFEKDAVVLNVVIRIAVSLMALQLLRFTLRFFELTLRGYMHEKIAEKVRIRLYEHIQDLSYEYHNKTDSGDLIQRVTSDVQTTTDFLATRVLDLVHLLATLFFGAYQLIRINPVMVFVTLGVLPFIAIASILYFTKVEKIFERIEEDEAQMVTVVQENLSGARVVRAFANEPFEIQKMEEKNVKHRNSIIKVMKIIALYWGSMDFIAGLQYLVIITIGIINVRRGTMDAADVAASLVLVGMLIWPIRGLGRIINEYSKALVAADRIHEIMDTESEYTINGTLKPQIKGKIEFSNVSFKFSDTHEHLLKDVNFTIEEGMTVAIIGRTGSGKSTIINLLMRMYDYDQGQILIDDIPLKEIEKRHIRSQIGVVLQDPFLYSKTVFENIAIAHQSVDEQAVYRAARVAALEKDLKGFKQGFDTMVGEKGTTLSGGQKQRVAIARVLIANQPILIFDDALSAVDTETDIMIRNALAQRDNKQTTLIITHRITTAKEADRIIVLDQGQIEAIGTHETLAHQEGLYKKLWDIQGKLEKEFLSLLKEGE